MAKYDISHGGLPQTWGNVGFAQFPSREVGPYDFMEAAAHFRPTTLTINRYLWFGNPNGYFAELDGEAQRSPALTHFLRNLRATGDDITTEDELVVITLPIDNVFERLFIRNMRSMPGFAVNLALQDQDGAVVHDFGTFDLSVPHLDRSAANPPVYTEGFIAPMIVPSVASAQADAAAQALADAEAAVADPGNPTPEEQEAIDNAQAAVDAAAALVDAEGLYGRYLGHNHELVLRFTSIPEGESIDGVKLIVAAQVTNPWLGAW